MFYWQITAIWGQTGRETGCTSAPLKRKYRCLYEVVFTRFSNTVVLNSLTDLGQACSPGLAGETPIRPPRSHMWTHAVYSMQNSSSKSTTQARWPLRNAVLRDPRSEGARGYRVWCDLHALQTPPAWGVTGLGVYQTTHTHHTHRGVTGLGQSTKHTHHTHTTHTGVSQVWGSLPNTHTHTHTHTRILFNHKKEQNLTICDNMDGT